MNKITNVAVFCGAHVGNHPIYAEMATHFARALVKYNHALVYGGGRVGLMGCLANEVLRLKGKVIGIMPADLVNKELAHESLTKLHVVADMQERKKLLLELSDGFVMMPGGTGTLDEFFEALTLAQLGYHQKPCGIYNINNYYDSLLASLEKMVSEGFMSPAHKEMLVVDDSAESLLKRFVAYEPPSVIRWVKAG